MTETSAVMVRRHAAVTHITLSRPDALNAISPAMAQEIHAALDVVEGDAGSAAVLVTGAGRAFCAGADIAMLRDPRDAAEFEVSLAVVQRLVERIAGFSVPTVAAVHGRVLGGGFELAMACDIRIAAEDATFGVPEIKLGLVPGSGGTQRLARMVPAPVARDMLLTGDPLSAVRAQACGLVRDVLPVEDLLDAGLALAARLAAGPQAAQRAIRRLLEVADRLPLDEGLVEERREAVGLFETPERAEGVRAFFEKRPPQFGLRHDIDHVTTGRQV